ncbi:MAG: hypothetical protein AAF847_08025 [Bacteroidota bacterium]
MKEIQANLFEGSCSHPNTREPLTSSPQQKVDAKRHLLLKCLSVYKLFEGFELDIHAIEEEQKDLLDRIRAYLLVGGQPDLAERLCVLTDEHEDLWISFCGMRSIIKENRLSNLVQLDYFFDQDRKKRMHTLLKTHSCE